MLLALKYIEGNFSCHSIYFSLFFYNIIKKVCRSSHRWNDHTLLPISCLQSLSSNSQLFSILNSPESTFPEAGISYSSTVSPLGKFSGNWVSATRWRHPLTSLERRQECEAHTIRQSQGTPRSAEQYKQDSRGGQGTSTLPWPLPISNHTILGRNRNVRGIGDCDILRDLLDKGWEHDARRMTETISYVRNSGQKVAIWSCNISEL